jgi:hypothetical protein
MQIEQKLLKLIAAAHVVAGVLLPLLLFAPALQPMVLTAIYGDASYIMDARQIIFWICILGPTVASWGLLYYALLNQYFLHPSPALWHALLGALIVWAPLDSALCLYNGITIGAVMNVLVTTIIIVLLFRVKAE